MRDNWTDKLPSLMEGHQEAPPEGLWDAVQAGVNRPKVVWWPWAASLAAAAVVVLAVFLWKPAAVPADTPVLLDVPQERVADVLVQEEPVVPVEEPVVAVPRVHREPVLHTEPEISDAGVQEEPVLHTEEPETHREEAVSGDQVQEKPEVHPEEPVVVQEQPVVWPQEPDVAPRKAGRVLMTVSSGGAMMAQASSSVTQGYGVAYNPGMSQDTPAPKIGKSSISTQMLSRNRPSTTEAQHRQRLRVSLGVNYEFAPCWSIGSGLTYSILRSDYTTQSGTTETQTARQLHYLGVPLNVQYQVVKWGPLSLYLNAGPMLETAVGARVNTRSFVSGTLTSDQQESISCKDWRWSLNAGVGAQLQLFRGGSLFVQPGISWHIPNDSGVESCYSARPLAFALDFGFRINL